MTNKLAQDTTMSPQVEKAFVAQSDGSYAEVIAVSGNGVTDSAGTLIYPQSMSHVYAYDGSGNVLTDTATDGTSTWIKTYTYSGTNVITASKWVKQ